VLPDRPAHHRDRTDRAIQAASWLGALAMFAYGACLSFDVLHHIAQACGLSPRLAWAWPLGFEAFMAVAAVAVLAEQRARPRRTPWYPWTLTALAAGSSIALNFAHPFIPLDPPPRLLAALVYGVPPLCAPFAWHLFLLRLAHRRHQPAHDAKQVARLGQQDQGASGSRSTVMAPPALPSANDDPGGTVNGQTPGGYDTSPDPALVPSRSVRPRRTLAATRAVYDQLARDGRTVSWQRFARAFDPPLQKRTAQRHLAAHQTPVAGAGSDNGHHPSAMLRPRAHEEAP